jgi:gliding motility-associated lipoprotein GldD
MSDCNRNSNKIGPSGSEGLVLLLLLIVGLLPFSSCKNTDYPRPVAYPRLSYPSSHYVRVVLSDAGIRFEQPDFTKLRKSANNKNWYNLYFEGYKATLYLDFERLSHKDANQYLLENEKLIFKQTTEKQAIKKEAFEPDDKRFVGFLYHIQGNTPSPFHLFVNNDRGRICAGSLVFDYEINSDSVSTILNGIESDLRHFIETLYFTP